MRSVHLFMFLLALPFFAALGHDIYLFITNGGSVDTLQQSLETTLDQTGEPGVKSLFATLGYIWTHYHPESYKIVVEGADEQTWAYINYLLAQKAVVVTAAFAGFFYTIIFVLRLFGIGKAGKNIVIGSGRRSDQILNPGKKAGKMQYKRK